MGLGVMFALFLWFSAENELAITTLANNFWQVIRAAVCGAVGLLLIAKTTKFRQENNLDETSTIRKHSQIVIILIVILLHLIYSQLIYSVLYHRTPYIPKLNSMSFSRELNAGLLGALIEELTFRLFLSGVLYFVFKRLKNPWLLIVPITALAWSLIHLQDPNSDWQRLVHLLPLGVALGLVMRTYGYRACLLTHSASNALNLTAFSLLIWARS
jgi:hypothetical protein